MMAAYSQIPLRVGVTGPEAPELKKTKLATHEISGDLTYVT